MQWQRPTADMQGSLTAIAKVTVNGAQTVEGRWRANSNTAEMDNRSLMLVQVSP